jgi:hypothetical protein
MPNDVMPCPTSFFQLDSQRELSSSQYWHGTIFSSFKVGAGLASVQMQKRKEDLLHRFFIALGNLGWEHCSGEH